MFRQLTSYDPQDGYGDDDYFADTLDEAVTVFCVRELMHHIGLDGLGDHATDALDDAMTEDGIDLDRRDHARDFLKDTYPRPEDWLYVIRSDADRATKRMEREKAKRAVIRFIQALWA